MNEELTPFGEYLLKLRILNDESQRQMADNLGFSTAYLSNVERGLCVPSWRLAYAVAEHYEEPPSKLLDLANISVTFVKIDLRGTTLQERELALLFSQRLRQLSPETAAKIQSLLDNVEA